ncbi:MAG: hypothetical protein M0R40_08770 [Firmicutes bacterium]|nr:hypothetical protein [Bacillota bacterium]
MNEFLSADWAGLSYRQVQNKLKALRQNRILKKRGFFEIQRNTNIR